MKNQDLTMIKNNRSAALAAAITLLGNIATISTSAQSKIPPPQSDEDYTWWYLSLTVLLLGLGGAVLWMVRSRRANSELAARENQAAKARVEEMENGAVDADRELEWFRKARKASSAKAGNDPGRKKQIFGSDLPRTSKVLNRGTQSSTQTPAFSENEIREKLQQLQFNQLPISKLKKLELARPFSPLPISNDDALMSAIEQTQDEYEEDEAIRDLAVRILARFKTRNSVESLAQVALYDLSSNLRSKAVSILADFDHESVFETILLCCADPTREVRAAAARGLFRLSFDRADAWTRICETNEEFRMRQAARAAMEADLVVRSLDRLVHQDQKIAYEAFTLLALMIKTGETREIFETMQLHRDDNVRFAFLRVVEVVGDDSVVPQLIKMCNQLMLPKEIKNRIDEVIASFEAVAV
jgi:hypothetical protein